MRNPELCAILFCCLWTWCGTAQTQQPAEPVDANPIDGETYYILNELTGLQAGIDKDSIVLRPRSFTDLGQRWAFTSVAGGLWQISNLGSGLCLEGGHGPTMAYRFSLQSTRRPVSTSANVIQTICAAVDTQRWALTQIANGYYTISNNSTGLLIDLSGTSLGLTPLSGAASVSQRWLLRPAFFRGIDNALLEKQEAARGSAGLPWWNDAGQQQDVLRIFKNHGVNMVRLRPSSAPPYVNPSQTGCSGNACYAETDAQDLDLAKRAKNLGMSVELTLLFDGGGSSSVPPAWTKDTLIADLLSDVYAYVKTELLAYRSAGTMPDLVSIGNEVDTGFLGALGSPTGADFGGFAALQIEAIQAVKDAAADTSLGPAIPAPLICIHITPAWDLTQFFTLANQNHIPYDAICQSYYPFFHGPLTDAQAAASNPDHKPVEQDVLISAAISIGKPIFIIEAGEHFENGFDSNDPWYTPPTASLQRQFLLDLQRVQKALPNNLGMGIAYWDPAGVNIPSPHGGLVNGDNLPDAIYSWNGLTLFDDDSMLLAGIDALGGKLDATLNYKFVNRGNGQILSASGIRVDAETDNGNPTTSQQWRIVGDDDGYFQIANAQATSTVIDGGNVVVLSPSATSPELEWNVVSAGNGYFNFVNRLSGLVLDLNGDGFAVQQTQDNSRPTQQWHIVAVH